MTNKNIQNITHFGFILMILICVYFFSQGYFTNPQLLQATLSKAGILAPLLFILLQIIQVIIPIIPGGASSALGITAFGAVNGFIYNYIGICIGSICIFLLVRKYGHRIILKLCKTKDCDKYMKYTYDQNKFDTFFMLAIFLPCAPDDLLCMLAGLTHMSLKKFVWIILLGKPLSLMAYSYGLTQLFQIIERWL